MQALIAIILALIGLSAGGNAYSASTEVGADGATTTDWGKFAGKFGTEALSSIGNVTGSVAKYWTGMSTTDKVVTLGAISLADDVITGEDPGTSMTSTAKSLLSSPWVWLGLAVLAYFLLSPRSE